MPITLEIHPEIPPLSWEAFCAETPPFSIALDGYVNTGPRFDPTGPRANFNHHEEVDRLATRATCAQVLMAIRQGLFERFHDEHGPHVHVFVNDCDEDVCTAWFLLEHPHLVRGTMNALVNRLVHMEEMLDATAGAYPFPADLPMLQELAWIFDPYRRFRLSGGVDQKNAADFKGVITDVTNRILKHLIGNGESIPLDTRYERVSGGPGWTMIREIGAQARTGMFSEGIHAYVAVRERTEGRYTYTVGRVSQFVPFDVSLLLLALHVAENIGLERLRHELQTPATEKGLMAIFPYITGLGGSPCDVWGGGNTIGGSPRVGGSKLTPEEVTSVVNIVIAAT